PVNPNPHATSRGPPPHPEPPRHRGLRVDGGDLTGCARVLVVRRRVWRAAFPIVPCERDMRDLVVRVQLHVAVTRRVLVPRRNDQVGLAELPGLLALHPRDMTARAHIPGLTLD